MEYIKDKSGIIVLAFDGDNLYYRSHEADENSDLYHSISIEQLTIENNGGLKLFTILEYQKELNIISDSNYIIKKVKKLIPYLAKIISEHEKAISSLEKRIVLLEMEVSGPASAGMSYLFLVGGNKTFNLCSSHRSYLSASEIIEVYGLGENEYWDQIQVNGEFIEEIITDIETVKDLHDGIVLLLVNEEQWNIEEDKINWVKIVNALLDNTNTYKLGIELKSKIKLIQNICFNNVFKK
jgi:hypothetical protein